MSFKYSILTFNFGKYDKLREPYVYDPECEYVFVTDDKDAKSSIWNVVYTEQFKGKSPIYASFYVRWHPFEFVHTDKCIVMDASIRIMKPLGILIDRSFKNDSEMGMLLFRSTRDRCNLKLKYWKNLRGLTQEEYDNGMKYVKDSIGHNYRGYVEATIRITQNTERLRNLDRLVWEDALKLGVNGNPIRLDEVPYSVVLQTKFKNMKTVKFDRRLIQGGYLQFCHHGSDEGFSIRLSPQQCGYYCNHKVKLEAIE